MGKKALMIHPKDNTATALEDIGAGDTIDLATKSGPIGQMKARQAVRYGHKLATDEIQQGEKVLKYGEVIGLATSVIRKGEHVHVHNVESAIVPPPKEVK